MNNLNAPLSDAEEEELEEFLLGRIPEDDYTDDLDEGVLVLPELDGFLTAIVSGPESLPPSQWLPALWGDFPPEWETPEQANHFFSLIFRHMNGIAGTLMQQPDDFEPMFYQRDFEGELVEIPDEWCEGYMRAVTLNPRVWEAGGKELDSLLGALFIFTEAGDFEAHNLPTAERDEICAILPNQIRAIHAFWLARRSPPQPVRNTAPQASRNDPCPCGSGRKYKKCCLQ